MRPSRSPLSSPPRARILVLVYGELGEQAAGPEMRGWAIAGALARRYDVTVAVKGSKAPLPRAADLRVVPASRGRLAREMLRHDALVAPVVPPYLLASKAVRPMLAVSDQYDPVELELGTLNGAANGAAAELRTARRAARLQLAAADVVLCAGERQRRRLAAELAETGGGGRAPEVVVVPFGIGPGPPDLGRRPLRDRFPKIAATDTVVLWWGSIWRWLDAETAVRALEPLAASRPDIKLVLTAGRPRNGDLDRFSATERARELAASLGLLGHTVFFLDEWIPYGQRHEYLLEADVGLTLHHDTPEARVAARARYMDYLWAGLPCVLAGGDDIADSFGAAGFATLVNAHDAAAARAAILRLANDATARAAAATAGRKLAEASRWEAVVEPLAEALDRAPAPRRLPPRASARVLSQTGAYYVHRLLEGVSA